MIVVVDYGMGNVGSVMGMGRKAGGELVLSSDPDTVANAEKLILPGVGAFDRGMLHLRERSLDVALNHAVLDRKVPILGICLGLQLFTRRSEEGASAGLGWLPADTIRFRIEGDGSRLKVPHMGWNYVEIARPDPLTTDLPEKPRFYFVHSFHLVVDDAEDVLLWSQHGSKFAAAVRSGNVWGTQFHPEKSHRYGAALIRNFVNLR